MFAVSFVMIALLLALNLSEFTTAGEF